LTRWVSAGKIISIAELTLSDAKDGKTDEDFYAWTGILTSTLKSCLPKLDGAERTAFMASLTAKKFTVKLINSPSTSSSGRVPATGASFNFQTANYLRAHTGHILSIKELRKMVKEDEKTLLVTIKIPNDIVYKLAENIAFYPKNISSQVEKVLTRFKIQETSLVTFEFDKNLDAKPLMPYPSGITVSDLLTNYLDLHCQIKKGDLMQIAKMLKADEKAKVLGIVNNRYEFNELTRKRMSLIDFIIEQKLTISFSDFVAVCPQINVT
jgi:sulfite reductase alpha subunit-like flavoprotein